MNFVGVLIDLDFGVDISQMQPEECQKKTY